jgi:hypothetical protein
MTVSVPVTQTAMPAHGQSGEDDPCQRGRQEDSRHGCAEGPVIGQAELRVDHPPDGETGSPPDHLRRDEITKRQDEGEERAADGARKREGQYDTSERVPCVCPEIDRRIQQRFRDSLERQEDRQDDEGQVDHHHGNQHRPLVKEEDLAGLFDHADAEQQLVHQPVQSEHGPQRIELHDVAHEQRNDGEQEEEIAPRAPLLPDEPGNRVAENHRDHHHLKAQGQRAEICAGIGPV